MLVEMILVLWVVVVMFDSVFEIVEERFMFYIFVGCWMFVLLVFDICGFL